MGDYPMSDRSFPEVILGMLQGDGSGGGELPAPESRQTDQGEGT